MAQEPTIVTIDAETYGQHVATRMVEWGGRDAAITALIAGLTELGIVIVYTDDTVKRRDEFDLSPDTPFPSRD